MNYFSQSLLMIFSMIAMDASAGMSGFILPPSKKTYKPASKKVVKTQDMEDPALIKNSRPGSFDAFIKATSLYKQGRISKDKFIEVALQASQLAESHNKVAVVVAPSVMAGNSLTSTSAEVNPPVVANPLQEYDPVTKKVKSCSEYSLSRGCKVGLYFSSVGTGGYFPLPDPVITVSEANPKILNGQRTIISWNVSAAEPVNCKVIDDDTKASVYTINGAGSWETPQINDSNRIPTKTYTVKCSYASGQYNYALVQISVGGDGTTYTRMTASKAKVNGGGSCTPYSVSEFPQCHGGCGPCEATNTHPFKSSTWTYVGAGQSGGCKSGFEVVWANAGKTSFKCEAED